MPMPLRLPHRSARYAAGLVALALAAGAAAPVHAMAARPEVVQSERETFRLVVLAEGLEHPWALALLPDGEILISERPGRLRLWRGGALQPEPLDGVPRVAATGQGGLLDIALDPDFASNRLVYFSYAGAGPGGAGTEVARARLGKGGIEDWTPILAVRPKSGGGRHFGSRLVFGRDGLLYVTAGERGQRQRAQDLGDMAGSVLRIAPDGSVPADNPFVGQAGAAPEIYSYGHRNPQGLTRDPATGAIWAVEHGPRGGDELNRIEPGVNYGWPVITYGQEYSGGQVGEGSAKPGMAQPVTYWVPSVSPSGLAFYDSDKFPNWRGSLFLGALSGQALIRLEMRDGKVAHEERLLRDFDERIRDVRQGPDGFLYLLTDSDEGLLLRLEPAG